MSMVFEPESAPVQFRDQKRTQVLQGVRPVSAWNIIHHPTAYYWAGVKYGWLPELKRQFLRPGANGVSDAHGYVDDTRAIINAGVHGHRIIKISSLPEALQSCTKVYPGAHGAVHVWSWVTYKMIGQTPKIEIDLDTKHKFEAELIKQKIIPAIHPDVEEIKITELQDQLAHYESLAEDPRRASARKEADRLRKILAEVIGQNSKKQS